VIWPDAPPEARTLWNARLYPWAADRDESLRLSLPLQALAQASAEWRAKWQAARRLSLSESFLRANSSRILADIAEIEDYVAAKQFYAAMEAEQPAEKAKQLLGPITTNVLRRRDLMGDWLVQTDPILRLRGYKALAVASERGGAVLNAAITLRGAHPIVAQAMWLVEPKLILESRHRSHAGSQNRRRVDPLCQSG
jgi:hypothetical protein